MASTTPKGSRTTIEDALAVLAVADTVGAQLWIDGGWGVDALLGLVTREHGDLDVAIRAGDCEQFVASLLTSGFARVTKDGMTAWNFLLAHPRGAVVDLHVITLDAEGNGVLGPPEAGNVYPAASLTGQGTIGGRAVDCISAEWVVRFHDAYQGDTEDRADVRALCERFDLEIPEQYR